MVDPVNLAMLGLQKLSQVEEVQAVLKYSLRFLFSEETINDFFRSNGSLDAIRKKLDEVNKKLDILLKESESSSGHFMRDALIAYQGENFDHAIDLFKQVHSTAVKAFNQATTDNLESLINCTQLKIAAMIIMKSYEGGHVKTLSQLPENRTNEIAITLKEYVDDLLTKADGMKAAEVLSITNRKRAMVWKKFYRDQAIKKMDDINSEFNTLLANSYPILSQFLGWSNASEVLEDPSRPLAFKVSSKYLPTSPDLCNVVVAREPRITVSMCKSAIYAEEDFTESHEVDWRVEWHSGRKQNRNKLEPYELQDPANLTLLTTDVSDAFKPKKGSKSFLLSSDRDHIDANFSHPSMNSIPVFSGWQIRQLNSYIAAVDALKTDHAWTEAQTVQIGLSRLEGVAKTWIENQAFLQVTYDSWSDPTKGLKRALSRQFEAVDEVPNQFPQQAEGESVRAFYIRVVEAVRFQHSAENELSLPATQSKLRQVIVQLFEENCKPYLREKISSLSHPINDLEEFLAALTECEGLVRQGKAMNGHYKSQSSHQQSPKARKGSVKCFECHQVGHIQKNCPKKKGLC